MARNEAEPAATAGVEVRIHESMQTMTSAEKRAARGLLANYPTLGFAPVAEFAKASEASPATVLRFVARLGFKSYPDFQRALREELEERTKSPLQRSAPQPAREEGHLLDRYFAQTSQNLHRTAAGMPVSEFESTCKRLADLRHGVHLAGGRFTDWIAGYLEAHLRIIRPGIRRLDGRPASRADQMLDIRPGDTAVLFDVRRYDDTLFETACSLAARRVHVILITDEWLSPISRVAKTVLPCAISVDRTWDANMTLFALSEAIIARTTELAWPSAEDRISAVETR
ncbi:MurR/RpiR family transcriptional regulator [Pelagibacterium limicola]|uniref:MurR/RpiR family transcriptional regulator n=1 Tax=Pelagibacterium limicola TaxID=2791022 RepID=UPI0018AFA695|nr:MurR/RpiR family transcriptional regulator [Pelagibacterium limicola]